LTLACAHPADHLSTLWGKWIIGTLGGEPKCSLRPSAAQVARPGPVPFTDLIEYFPLDQVNEAVAASHAGEVVKPVLRIQ
jgi:aryl-alcohol dehydrogenase